METCVPFDPRFIARMGLHGLQHIALPLVCVLVRDASLLLIGRHGSAKTALARLLAAALGLRFRVFDAGKTPFEDLIGFVDPTSLAEGLARYVATPLSAWDAGLILVDELSRADERMQSKFLELIYERTLMGLPMRQLRYVVAAANPASYLGAGPIDEALLGRFDVVLQVPEFTELSQPDQLAALQAGAGLCGSEHDSRQAGHQPELVAFIESARRALPTAEARVGQHVVHYVVALARAARAEHLRLDGRRLVMIARNLLAAHAVLDAGWDWEEDEEALYGRIVEVSVPYIARDEDFDPARIRSAHAVAWGAAGDLAHQRACLLDILGDGDSDRALRRYLERASQLDVTEHDRVVHRVQEELRLAPLKARTQPALRVLELLRAVQQRHQDFPPELVARLLTWGRRLLGLDRDSDHDLLQLVQQAGAPIDLSTPGAALAARLALQLSMPELDNPVELPSLPHAARNLGVLRAALDHPAR
jgi:MoxR-like ATPase